MPYIKQALRKFYKPRVESAPDCNPGILNFQITTLCIDYLEQEDESYAAYNAVIGALDCAKMELYRRMIIPYEEEKIEENGDIYHDET